MKIMEINFQIEFSIGNIDLFRLRIESLTERVEKMKSPPVS
jgi:hypothetical protein